MSKKLIMNSLMGRCGSAEQVLAWMLEDLHRYSLMPDANQEVLEVLSGGVDNIREETRRLRDEIDSALFRQDY